MGSGYITDPQTPLQLLVHDLGNSGTSDQKIEHSITQPNLPLSFDIILSRLVCVFAKPVKADDAL